MKRGAKSPFRPVLELKASQLAPSASFSPEHRNLPEYRTLGRSLRSFGMIMPLVVHPLPDGRFKILDGNKRFYLRHRRTETIACVVATDDELGHNRRSGYLSALAKHDLTLRALARHSIDRVALALGVHVDAIERSRDLLNGLCEEALTLLRDKNVTLMAIEALREMKRGRQKQAAELMIALNRFSGSTALCLTSDFSDRVLLKPCDPRLSTHQIDQMGADVEVVLKESKNVLRSYGTNVLELTIFGRYIELLLVNERIASFILAKQPETFCALRSLVGTLQKERSETAVTKRRLTFAAPRIGSRDRKMRARQALK